MRTATITSADIRKGETVKTACLRIAGFYPAVIIRVDSGDVNVKAWRCFESAEDARLWRRQR